jgi:hypothetical protein
MMAETLAQENHCFSLTGHSTCCRSSNPNSHIPLSPEMANAVICPETGNSLKHQELITKLKYKNNWMKSTANEINRLYNTNTIRFIQRSAIPKGRKVTYGSFVVYIKDHKEERERMRLTVGGDQIEYPGDKSTRTAGLTTARILINSVISTTDAQFMVIDIKIFLFEYPPRMVRIHGYQFGLAPSGNHRKVLSARAGARQKGIHRDPERHVRIATSRHLSQRIVTP